MPKHSRTKSRTEDVNEAAFRIVQEATRESGREPVASLDVAMPPPKAKAPKKNPAAVALGRLGGKKGGPARAEKLSPERRSEIARKAAATRWKKEREQD